MNNEDEEKYCNKYFLIIIITLIVIFIGIIISANIENERNISITYSYKPEWSNVVFEKDTIISNELFDYIKEKFDYNQIIRYL